MSHKVLIVDDEPFLLQLLEQTLEDLEDLGVEILTANNGEAALDVIKKHRPALVFLDVMMPKMNGFDVCRTVKHDLNMQDVFIIMLTAKGQGHDRQKGEEVGANIYMTKPFDPDEIVEKAKEILGL